MRVVSLSHIHLYFLGGGVFSAKIFIGRGVFSAKAALLDLNLDNAMCEEQ